MKQISPFYALLGLGFMVAGFDKLAGLRSYERLFRHFGWSRDAMQLTGAAELAGGAMVICPCTRRLGGAVLTAVSGTVLSTELQHRDPFLALPRFALMAAAAAALLRDR